MLSNLRIETLNNKSRKFSRIVTLSFLLTFVWGECASGTPNESSLNLSANAMPQGPFAIEEVRHKENPRVKPVWSNVRFAMLEDQAGSFSKESAFVRTRVNDSAGKASGTNTVTDLHAMLLFASALIGMASIGRKRFLKK